MRVGIIGCGLMGQRRAAHLDGDDVLVGGYDPGPATKWTGPRMDLGQLIEQSEAVIVATPHDVLASRALLCLNAGKPVLLEKPCARSAAELSPVLAAAIGKKLVAVGGFTLRHYPGMDLAKVFTKQREVVGLQIVYGHPGRPGYEKEWRCDPDRGGGELLDQGVHLLDLAQWLLGPCKLQYSHRQFEGWSSKVEDTVFLHLQGPHGSSASLEASWMLWEPTFELKIVCKDATARVAGLGGRYGEHGFIIYERGTSSPSYKHSWKGANDIALTNEWRHFKTAVREGHSDLESAMNVLNLVDQVRSCR